MAGLLDTLWEWFSPSKPAGSPVEACGIPKKGGGGGGGKPNSKPPPPPPKPKVIVKLVELVEVMEKTDGTGHGVVVGPGAASGKLPTVFTRTEKAADAFKQFINLDKDLPPARDPSRGRWIEVKARVECTPEPHSGQSVAFTFKTTPDEDRPSPFTGPHAEGFAGGSTTKYGTTDAEGWTEAVRFYLSRFAGDSFTISAEAAEDKGNVKTIGAWQVWRKFWYQITRSKTHVVPDPDVSVAAYHVLKTDMKDTPVKQFEVTDAPARTFYPGWMVRVGGGDDQQSVIGGHNREDFYKMFNAEADKPVKGHLIICQHQWDPFGESALLTQKITSNPSEELSLVLDGGAWNAGVVTPALSGDLIVTGTWTGKDGTAHNLTAADILVDKTRSALNAVRVKLPVGAPDPSKEEVTVSLKLRFGKFYAGESNKHQMLIVYRGDEAAFTQVVSHEFGHGFGQTPRKDEENKPLPKHPKQYSNERGGSGSHCSTDATLVDDASMTSKKRFTGGTCIMFHQVNPGGCKQVFCPDCEPHLKLQDFAALG